MKKFVITLFIITVAVAVFIMTGCSASAGGYNKQIFDFTYAFDEAIIAMPNGEIVEGKVQSWTDFEDGDQIQVTINDKTYLVHSENVALIANN